MAYQDPIQVAPDSYILDDALLQRPGNEDIQLNLFFSPHTQLLIISRGHLSNFYRQYAVAFIIH
jgi:hypothetical protein